MPAIFFVGLVVASRVLLSQRILPRISFYKHVGVFERARAQAGALPKQMLPNNTAPQGELPRFFFHVSHLATSVSVGAGAVLKGLQTAYVPRSARASPPHTQL